MVYCMVPRCKNNDWHKKGVDKRSFHRIPNKENRTKWLCAIFGEKYEDQREYMDNIKNPGARVCSDHFNQADYSISSSRKSLLAFAIPSIFAEDKLNKALVDKGSHESRGDYATKRTPLSSIMLNGTSNDTRNPYSSPPRKKRLPQKVQNVNEACQETLNLVATVDVNEASQETLNLVATVDVNEASQETLNLVATVDVNEASQETSNLVATVDVNEDSHEISYLSDASLVNEKTNCDISNQYFTPRKETITQAPILNRRKQASRLRRLLFENTSTEAETQFITSNSIGPKCMVDEAIQVSVPITSRRRRTTTRKQSRVISNLKNKIDKLNKKVSRLVKENKEMKNEKKEGVNVQFRKVVEGSTSDLQAAFLLEQILSYQKKKMPYHESTLKICCILFRKSSSAYNFIRELGILRLPHRITLARYVGHSSGEEGINKLVKLRLKEEFDKVKNDHETLGSLVMDEMSIKPKLLYDRNMDTFFGQTSSASLSGINDTLATHLLCFVFHGIGANIRIPVAFYFTRNTDGVTLHKYCMEVLKIVEESGFVVVRFVSDNAKVNTMAYKIFGNGILTHVIPHPFDPKRKLFFAFDQSHLIKNLRSLFLSRDMVLIGLNISADFIKKLYNMQKENLVKAVRFLTRKVVFPNNLEKMNVLRAVQLFSKPLTSALKTLLHLGLVDERERENLEATIFFMETIRKWYEIHDIANKTHAIHSRNENKIPFSELDDERLEWLQEEFLPFLAIIQDNATHKMERLSDETYEAIQITTKSTVALIKYLLEGGFHYVLTRKLSSDIVEMTFSHIRQSGGRNDQMDVRAATLSIERTLKIGIIKSSGHSNVGQNKCLKETLQSQILCSNTKSFRNRLETSNITNPNNATTSSSQPVLSWGLQNLLNQMDLVTPNDHCMISIRSCSVALIGGYIVRVAEENTNCPGCLEKLIQPQSGTPLLYLIKANDNGGLKYPSRLLIRLLVIVLDFVQSSITFFTRQNVLAKYVEIILPHFQKPLKCDRNCVNLDLPKLLLEKYLRPLLNNYAKDVSDRMEKVRKYKAKPLSRKILKV